MKLPPFTADESVDSPGIPYRGRPVWPSAAGLTCAWAVIEWCAGIAVLGCLACPPADCVRL